MVSTKEGMKFLMQKDTASDLRKLNQELNAVKARRGFYNIARLRRMDLIKEHTTKKGRMVQGQISGRKYHYVLTDKGRRVNAAISQIY